MAGISNQTGRGIDFAFSHTVDRGSGIWRQTALGRSLGYRPGRISRAAALCLRASARQSAVPPPLARR